MAKKRRMLVDFSVFSKVQLTSFIILMVLALLLGVGIPVLLSSNMLFSIKTTRTYRANELSDEDLISPISFTIIDEEATEKERDERAKEIIPYFSYSYSSSLAMKEDAEEVYNLINTYAKDGTVPDGLNEAMKGYLLLLNKMNDGGLKVASIVKETVDHYIKDGVYDENDLMYVFSEGKNEINVESPSDLPYSLENKVVNASQCTSLSNLRSSIYQWLIQSYKELSFEEMQIIADICQMIIRPNMEFDEIHTRAMIESARNSVEPVVVKIEKGDYLLRMDTLVTEKQLSIIDELNNKSMFHISALSILPRIIMVSFILIFWFIFQYRLVTYSYRKAQFTLIVLSLMDFSLFLGFFISWKLVNIGITEVASYMPFLIAGMVATTISNKRSYGLSAILVLSALYTLWPTAELMSFFYIVLTASAVNLSIKSNKGRLHTIIICLQSVCSTVAITLFFGLFLEKPVHVMLLESISMAVNVIISFILYSILVPVLEKAFNIPTKQRLMELAYYDNPVISQLSKVAQGTYNHVKNVSDLAYAGAVAIGANAELALVGARYHDIGKMVHPEYFIENQNDKNAHDAISSQLSRSIIKSHVRLGTEKGKEIGLSQEVLDIIGEHHGNDIIRYFYNEAVKNAGKNDTVVKEDFMYDGNIPSTKESAIVMLADCVEAATRTINRPNHQKYEKFINNIFSDKISHGQLDNSNLTMTELKKIKEAFIPPLLGRDHHRISYDNDRN